MTVLAADIVEIDSGPVRGIVRQGMLAYLGVPYAAPPLGELRWMPPQRPERWSEVRDCSEYGNDSLQDADLGVFARAGGDEDCLYLNVFVPQHAHVGDKGLPVMVWIHGGATRVGSGRDYDPSKIVLQGNTIVITFNYRLGILGYFSHPEIDAEGHPFGNYGVLDQQLVLDWVQRNIAAFGGDPGNVTVFGESSGGNSTFGHIISPLSKGKFQHAISMSGGAIALKSPIFGAPVPLEKARQTGIEFAMAVECESAAELRQLSARQILAMQAPYVRAHQFIIDGTIIPTHPSEAFRSGNFNRVTVVSGHTADEGAFFSGFVENATGRPMEEAEYLAELDSYFGDLASKVIQEYPVNNYDSVAEAYAAVFTDYMFACTGRAILKMISRYTPTYAYDFADKTAPSYLEPTTFPLGAAHTYELPYLFTGFRGGGGLPVALNALQHKLSDIMIRYWTTVSQAAEREDEWSRYDPELDNFLILKLPEPRMVSGRFSKVYHAEFWDSIGIY
ncbi:carboxylesterase/lipase family protein [Sphingobium sp. EP60837]|uniref:carboxylesterase/lipase family protein n=1 Tax=Sphingobium sp. EP60837 TaxID=1855519 RepID=UPI0007DDFAD3|nr:carboxylesterase family protein [Sphingobium sp. EP60837]ANI80124.1 Cholinesterase [Sphingobium sp. EP60837]